jgi:uncharacterized phage-associated protein
MGWCPQVRAALPRRRWAMTDVIVRNSAAAVTNWFIERNQTDRIALTHLMIQKLLYFAQGWHLANFDSPLFEDPIEAWTYGPVVESVYQVLKYTEKQASVTDFIPGKTYEGYSSWQEYAPKLKLHDGLAVYIEKFWNQYSKLDPWVLVNASHRKGTPWEQVTSSPGYNRYGNSLIPVELMKVHFKSQLPRKD